MTEYDYSPAAYERYVAQQTRVSNWVSDTLQQSHAWSNPFVLSPTLRDRSFYDGPDGRAPPRPRYNSYDEWSSSSSRPSRTRSRSHVEQYYDRTAPPRHRTQSHSRSPPDPPSYVYPQPPPRAPPTRPSHGYQYPSPAPAHARSPTRQATVTQPPPGQVYYLSQPAHDTPHRRVSHSRHPSSNSNPPPQPYLYVQGGGPKAEYKRGPPIHAPVPTKPHAQQQPLYKRLLGFVTTSPVAGRSGNGRGYRGPTY